MKSDELTNSTMTFQVTSHATLKHDSLKASSMEFPSGLISDDFSETVKKIYYQLGLNYPKFFKMDQLSKLAFITSEILLKSGNLLKYAQDRIGIVLGNSFATLNTDLDYYATIRDKSAYFPSPAVFVYTLPNIMIGEICIRNHIRGENAFFVFKEFNHNFIHNYVSNLLTTGKIDCCITGWVDFRNSAYEAVLYLVEPGLASEPGMVYTSETTRKIYIA